MSKGLLRNSIIINDPEMGNFMLDPNEEKAKQDHLKEKNKKKKKEENENESFRILEDLFPGYAIEYHEKYQNNQDRHHWHTSTPHHHHLAIINIDSSRDQTQPNHLHYLSGHVGNHTNDTLDLSLHSLEENHFYPTGEDIPQSNA